MSSPAEAERRALALSFWSQFDSAPVIKPVSALVDELALGEGRTNQNFIAEAGGVRYFVRIGGDLPAYGVTRAKEQEASRAAASAGVGPAVHHTEADAMVVAFCPGKTMTDAEFRGACAGDDPALLARVAAALRTLHAIAPPPALAAAASQGWAPADVWRWLELAESKGFARLPLVAKARPLIAELEAAAGPVGPPTFCHHDLLPDNLVLGRAGDDRVWVVDFEYAAAGQPLMDLAVMAMGCELGAAEEGALLAAYDGAAPTADARRRFAALKVLACLRETLWGVVAEVSGTSALPPAEAAAYADKNYARLAAAHAAFFAPGS